MDLGACRIVRRDAQLGLLSPEGARGALVVDGEAGIGKSTGWTAALERFRAAGFQTLIARPVEAEGTLAFAGLTDLLVGVLVEAVEGLSTPRRRRLRVAMMEEQADRPVDPLGIGLALLDALRRLAQTGRGVLIAIDDMQWLDA